MVSQKIQQMKIKKGTFPDNNWCHKIYDALDDYDVVGVQSPGPKLARELSKVYSVDERDVFKAGNTIFIRRKNNQLTCTRWQDSIDVNHPLVIKHFKETGELYIGITKNTTNEN